MRVSVLATDRAAIEIGGVFQSGQTCCYDTSRSTTKHVGLFSVPYLAGDNLSKLGSLDGQIDVLVCGGSLEVQAGEQLQRLRIVGRGRGVGNNGELGMMELHLPGNLSAEAQILAAQACK